MLFIEYPSNYFTATIMERKHLLNQQMQAPFISCLQFSVKEDRIQVYVFTVMSNPIYIICM